MSACTVQATSEARRVGPRVMGPGEAAPGFLVYDHNGSTRFNHGGCPNCGEPGAFVGDVREVTAPCSRKCALQLEYAESLKARDESATAETSVKGGRKAEAPGAESLRRASASASAVRSHADAGGAS